MSKLERREYQEKKKQLQETFDADNIKRMALEIMDAQDKYIKALEWAIDEANVNAESYEEFIMDLRLRIEALNSAIKSKRMFACYVCKRADDEGKPNCLYEECLHCFGYVNDEGFGLEDYWEFDIERFKEVE